MYRMAMENLLVWKQSRRRKPLIIEGARQVGKTWLMKEFGRQAYGDTVYINFDSNARMAELFASDLDTKLPGPGAGAVRRPEKLTRKMHC